VRRKGIVLGVPGGFDEVSRGREEIKCQQIKYMIVIFEET
jgi:hypothetical protein